jgi:hypothetical protein
MPRTGPGSRKPLDDEPPPLPLFRAHIPRGHVRRGGVAQRVNRFVQPKRYYGLMSALNGDDEGPWLMEFECTDAAWFEDTLEEQMPPDYRLERIEQQIGQRDYMTAWDSAIGTRVVLRHAFEYYRELAGSPDNPAPLAFYQVSLDGPEDLGRIAFAHDNQPANIEPGLWYGLELGRCPLTVVPSIDTGILTPADPATDNLAAPEAWSLLRLHQLPAVPKSDVQDLDIFQGHKPFLSQAVLQAMHFARGL